MYYFTIFSPRKKEEITNQRKETKENESKTGVTITIDENRHEDIEVFFCPFQ